MHAWIVFQLTSTEKNELYSGAQGRVVIVKKMSTATLLFQTLLFVTVIDTGACFGTICRLK